MLTLNKQMTVAKYLPMLVNLIIFDILIIRSILHNIEINSLFVHTLKITETFVLDAATFCRIHRKTPVPDFIIYPTNVTVMHSDPKLSDTSASSKYLPVEHQQKKQ